MRTGFVFVLCVVAGCGTSGTPTALPVEPDAAGAPPLDAGGPADGAPWASDAGGDAAAPGADLRIMAANISCGPSLSYGPAEGVRLLQGLKPDVVLAQEFNSGTSTDAELGAFVASTFGASFTYYREREPGVDIPNAIISRFPILESGRWADPQVQNRGFAYAKLAIPGPHPLWAISLHLLTTSGSARDAEASALVTQVRTLVPDADYLVIGGDLNTGSRTESALSTLSAIVVTSAPFPDDGAGNESTNAPRSKAYDWVLADLDLGARQVPTKIGARSFPAGLVFDSRIYAPLADVAPIAAGDSAAQNMQHMPVVRDFHVGD